MLIKVRAETLPFSLAYSPTPRGFFFLSSMRSPMSWVLGCFVTNNVRASSTFQTPLRWHSHYSTTLLVNKISLTETVQHENNHLSAPQRLCDSPLLLGSIHYLLLLDICLIPVSTQDLLKIKPHRLPFLYQPVVTHFFKLPQRYKQFLRSDYFPVFRQFIPDQCTFKPYRFPKSLRLARLLQQ